MSRSKWRGVYMSKALVLHGGVEVKKGRQDFRSWSRDSIVPGYLVGKAIFVHNGLTMVRVFITREKVGFKLGEFAFTRKHTKKENKTKK